MKPCQNKETAHNCTNIYNKSEFNLDTKIMFKEFTKLCQTNLSN